MATPANSASLGPPLRTRLIRGSALAFTATVLGQLFAVVTSIIYARLLGRDGLGVLAIYTQLANLAVVASGLALGTPITKFVAQLRAQDRVKLEEFVSTALTVSIAAALVASAALFVLGDQLGIGVYGSPELAVMVRIGAAFLVLNALTNVGIAILQGLQAIGRLSIFGIVLEAAGIPVMFLSITAFGLIGAAIGGVALIALASSTLFGSAWRGLRRDGIRLRLGFAAGSARALTAYVLPLLASTIIIKLAFLYQSSLLALHIGYGDAGLFRVASAISRIVAFVPAAITVPLLPAMSELYATAPRERSREHLTTILRVTAYAGVPVALAVGFAASPLIGFLYGPDYIAASTLAFVLVLAGFVDMVNAIAANSFISEGRMRLLLGLDALQVAVLTVSTTIFLSWFGLMGVGYAAAVNSVVYGSAILLLLGQSGRIDLPKVTNALVLAAFGFAVASLAMAWGSVQANSWFGAAIVAAWVVAAWFLMGPKERQVFKGAAGELFRWGG